MSVKKFLSLERLQEYDALIKAEIDAKIAGIPSSDVAAITTAEIDEICGASVVDASEVTF